MKWALVSDIHIPYHNERYLTGWFNFIKWWKPDVVDILGDLDDACPVSRFSTGTSIEYENAVVTYAPLIQKFFADLRGILPNSEIHFATGNHEARYDKYIDSKAPALAGLITPDLLWHTEKHGIDLSYYSAPPVKRYGGYHVHHGPYALKEGGDSSRKAMLEFGVSVAVGHSHAQAITAKTFELRDEIHYAIECGHLVNIHSSGMAYARLRDWQPGFVTMHLDGDAALPQIHPIIDDRFVVDGKLFKV